MLTFSILNDGNDYGEFAGETAAEALLAALRDSDPTRRYGTPELLTHSADYGRGSAALNGNGAQDRSRFWYVTDADDCVSVFQLPEVRG
jgi:hypothetical protein